MQIVSLDSRDISNCKIANEQLSSTLIKSVWVSVDMSRCVGGECFIRSRCLVWIRWILKEKKNAKQETREGIRNLSRVFGNEILINLLEFIAAVETKKF